MTVTNMSKFLKTYATLQSLQRGQESQKLMSLRLLTFSCILALQSGKIAGTLTSLMPDSQQSFTSVEEVKWQWHLKQAIVTFKIKKLN